MDLELQNLISEKVWTKEEHLDAALNDNLTPEALRVFLPDLLGRMHVEMFAHGNLTPEQAKKLLKVVEDGLGGNDVLSIPPNFLLRYRQAALPKKFAASRLLLLLPPSVVPLGLGVHVDDFVDSASLT